MKKLLILILIGLLLALSIFIVISGFQIGNIEVLSFTGIQDRNKELDETIQQASKLAEKDYKQAISNVIENGKKLEQTKKEYEDMTAISSQGDIKFASQLQKYEIETLWVKLGNYATSEGVVIRMDVVNGSASEVYNLKFTATGSYISITDFISDIENDSTLGFKIEEFKMLPVSSGSDLQATFVCKDISIKDVSATTNVNTNQDDDTTSDTNTTDKENNTNTTNDTNTTNTTNTTNNTKTNTTKNNNTSNNTNTTNSTNNVAQ